MNHRIIRIPAGRARWVRAEAGSEVIVRSPEGAQVADTWVFMAADPSEHLSVEHCRLRWGRVTPRVGDSLVSNRSRSMLTLLEDSSGGVHDTLLPACDAARYAQLGHLGFHRSCARNLSFALRSARLPPLTPSPLNLFENTELAADGGIRIAPPRCSPGGAVRFAAHDAIVVVVSACPQDLAPTNGADRTPKPIHVEIIPPAAKDRS